MPTFSDITDAGLDSVVEAIQHGSPMFGAVMVSVNSRVMV